ncbi:MAG TPA: C45 family peptidase [Nocardioidaceae bacterium]|nr:C45 family peptidase [Nocardioidaceae bacterium]
MTTVRTFTSSTLAPADRGRELGERHRTEIRRTIAAYRRLFAARATRPFEVDPWAEQAWATIGELAPGAALEIAGIAEGARVPAHEVAMLNARTELLAVADPTGVVDECSTVVALPENGPPVAVQTWDWYDAMSDDWFVWTIPHPDGHVVRTVTEYGVLGKIGVSSRGIGVLFNMLRHSDDAFAEEKGLGFPVHLLSRQILDTAGDLDDALAQATAVSPSASTSLTVVDSGGRTASVELFPGGPGVVRPEDGLLVRTNHFLSDEGAVGCLASTIGPSSEIRRATLLDAFGGQTPGHAEEVLTAMHDHKDVGGVCAHPDRTMDPLLQHATLATVVVDVEARQLRAGAGGPCARPVSDR